MGTKKKDGDYLAMRLMETLVTGDGKNRGSVAGSKKW